MNPATPQQQVAAFKIEAEKAKRRLDVLRVALDRVKHAAEQGSGFVLGNDTSIEFKFIIGMLTDMCLAQRVQFEANIAEIEASLAELEKIIKHLDSGLLVLGSTLGAQ